MGARSPERLASGALELNNFSCRFSAFCFWYISHQKYITNYCSMHKYLSKFDYTVFCNGGINDENRRNLFNSEDSDGGDSEIQELNPEKFL